MSVFSKSDITITGSEDKFSGEDLAHKKWAETADSSSYPNSYNKYPRDFSQAGIGTTGQITGGKVAGRDYDKFSTPSFKQLSSSDTSPPNMTFPFDTNAEPDIETLREAAQAQEADTRYNNYDDGHSGSTKLENWPSDATYNTVVFYRFTSPDPHNELTWFVSGDCSTEKKGILVVENGSFNTQPGKALFSGVVIVRGGGVSDSGEFTSTGSACSEGYANADGTIEIKGKVSADNDISVSDTAGFYGVRLWSWRELYQ